MEKFTPNTIVGHYKIIEVIGEGAFSVVFKGIHIPTRLLVAIKVINKASFPEDRFNRELNIMKNLYHPFCVSFYEYIEDENFYILVMEYIQGQTLLDYLNDRDELPDFVVRHFSCQIISAMDYLHNVAHFVHRDLKVENIMVDRYNNIRLIDFGLGNQIKNEGDLFTTACGSAAYAAPEILKGESYSSSADLWSLGVILYAMATGGLPFEDSNIHRLVNRIVLCQPVYPEDLDPIHVDLLRRLLNKDPVTRYTIDEVKTHPYFQKYPFASCMNKDLGIVEGYRTQENQLAFNELTFNRMKIAKLDVQAAMEELSNGVFGSNSASYRILRREHISEFLSSLYIRSRPDKCHPTQSSLPYLFKPSHLDPTGSCPSSPSTASPTESPYNSGITANFHGHNKRGRRMSVIVEDKVTKLAEGKSSLLCSSTGEAASRLPMNTRYRTSSPLMSFSRKRSNSIYMAHAKA
ncbi:CAMK family protein kinase [Tritrichomonas foetus]|uniref:non-specific serine/threonine protein kinase n=1 Tax=Tritrichomonas foetus TaxID=1144522 RepID=A0A1J4JES1_9EUKA|nr:CAMK family protein kinase [Tritrichomonas foetus]|eukprot:OHS95941.1 CAMK family protein kinase [Tritrichomonas foetus]